MRRPAVAPKGQLQHRLVGATVALEGCQATARASPELLQTAGYARAPLKDTVFLVLVFAGVTDPLVPEAADPRNPVDPPAADVPYSVSCSWQADVCDVLSW